MAAPGLESLSVLRITRIVQALQDARNKRPATYRFSSRLARANAVNGELMARFVGRVLIADLIALDSAAGVYASGKMTFETSQSPKIKIGRTLTESQMEQFEAIRNGRTTGDEELFDYISPIVENCLDGIDQRIEALCVAMYRDRLDYDRLGFKASGITWGMPSDLKVTPQIPWDDPDATPVDDVLNLLLLGRTRYGIEFNRLTTSTQAFRYAIATPEFQAKAKAFIPANLTFGNFSLLDMTTQRRLFEQALGGVSDGAAQVTVELNDDRYWYQGTDGNLASARYQPINEVYLDDSRNDRNGGVMDIAKGTVMESLLLGLNPGSVIGATSMPLNGARRGPLGYMTFPTDLNPPNVTLWGADVAWPRKHMLQATARMTVGTFVDTIPVTEAF